MLLLLLWFIGGSNILLHCIFSMTLLSLFIYYKINTNYEETEQLDSSNPSKSRVVISAIKNKFIMHRSRSFPESASFAKSHAIIVLLMAIPFTADSIYCAEQDANILKPLASVVKSIISVTTTGFPTPIEFGASDYVRDLMSLTLRTGFPASMPRGLSNKTQDFLNRVRARVAATDIKLVPRKRLADLRRDLDNIVDAIVDEARTSPDGLYTDYLNTKVNGMSLEDACVAVGTQLKAYGVDLSHYRDIAGLVLGIPLMPTLAHTAVSAAGAARSPISTISHLPGNLIDTGSQLAGAGVNVVSHLGGSAMNSYDTLRNYVPLPLPRARTLTAPFSIFSHHGPQAEPIQPVAS